jgi:osmotically-inducible protein OsmY
LIVSPNGSSVLWDPRVDAAEIGVTVEDGVVTLSGHVVDYAQKQAAVRATKRVYGVKAIADDIEVQLPGGSGAGKRTAYEQKNCP